MPKSLYKQDYRTLRIVQFPETWERIDQAASPEGYASLSSLANDLLRHFLEKVKLVEPKLDG